MDDMPALQWLLERLRDRQEGRLHSRGGLAFKRVTVCSRCASEGAVPAGLVPADWLHAGRFVFCADCRDGAYHALGEYVAEVLE